MCCNYCFYFAECKKAKKTTSDCCRDCAEYEFCPFVLGETAITDLDSPLEGDSDMDLFGSDEL